MHSQPLRLASAMRIGAGLFICLIAVSRCLLLNSSNPYFDLDPALTNELPSGVLGPSGSVLLDVVVLALCSIALFGETMRGRKIHWQFVGLAALPIVAIWFHGRADPLQYIHGSAWVAAMLACVSLAHVSRGARVSSLAPIALLALTIPLLASAAFAYGNHLQLVSYFEQHTQEILNMNGLQAGFPSAAVFEERLRSYGPMGWFTTPNVFGGVLVSLGVIWAFVAATLRQNKKLYFGGASLFALLCLIAAISTFSKASFVLGVLAVLLAACIFATKTEYMMKRWGGWIAVSIVLAAVYVVFFRGCLVETALSERSLLVRSQYFVGGLEIAGTHAFLGVGPAQIQDAWLGVRPESATEAIVSTHNIVIDWLASYGMVAFCWIAVLVCLLWNAGKKMWVSDRSKKRQLFAAGISVAAIVLVVDAQIDLTMFDVGSTLFSFCLLGIAGVLVNEEVKVRTVHFVTSMIPLFVACVILYSGYAPIAHDEYLQRNAATSIIANDPIHDVATMLADQSVTTQSKLIAARLFMSVGDNDAAIASLGGVAPTSGVWFLRNMGAATPEDALIAAQELRRIDPNGLQTALLLADALWELGEPDMALVYQRVKRLNDAYQGDPARMLPKSRIALINQRLRRPKFP